MKRSDQSWEEYLARSRREYDARARRAAELREQVGDTSAATVALHCPLSTWAGEEKRCRWCNAALTGRKTAWCSKACNERFNDNHLWSWARHAKLKADRYCARCGTARTLEVNHVVPIGGLHGVLGCWHHQAGLVVLCREHHLEETARQREAGLLEGARSKVLDMHRRPQTQPPA